MDKAIFRKLNLKNILNNIVKILFFLLCIYLFICSITSTSIIDINEHTEIVQDSFFKNVILLISLILLLIFILKKIKRIDFHIEKKKISFFFFILSFVIGMFFVLIVGSEPVTDQANVLYLGGYLDNLARGELIESSYLNTYPLQSGIVFIIFLYSKIFGIGNYFGCQVFNVLCYATIICTLSSFFEEDKLCVVTCSISMILFLPLLYFTTFVYGTMPGLLFSILSFKYLEKFKKLNTTKSIILSILFIFIGVMFKTNCMIFALAEIFYILLSINNENWSKTLIFIIFLLIILFTSSKLSLWLIESVSGYKFTQGLSKYSWITMGLGENESIFAGWWNPVVYKYYASSGYNTIKDEAICKDIVLQRLAFFKENPTYALNFFNLKNQSQWNNPGFCSYFINLICDNEIVRSTIAKYLLDNSISGITFRFFYIYQSFILFCAIFSVFDNKNNFNILLMLTIIGGFIFHTFWEAAGTYIMPYYVLLLPLMINGFKNILNIVNKFLRKKA